MELNEPLNQAEATEQSTVQQEINHQKKLNCRAKASTAGAIMNWIGSIVSSAWLGNKLKTGGKPTTLEITATAGAYVFAGVASGAACWFNKKANDAQKRAEEHNTQVAQQTLIPNNGLHTPLTYTQI